MAPIESAASVMDLIFGMNILVKVKDMARIAESISIVKIIIDPLCASLFLHFNFCILILV